MDTPENESKFVVCRCQHCEGHIEFDASDFQKGETRKAECPHCHMETIIFVPVPTNALKPKQIAATPPKTNPPAAKPSPGQKELFSIKVTSRAMAVFFAFTTFCLASILVWEHLANRSQPVSAGKISGSDTITVEWGGVVNKVRLDEVIFDLPYVRLKSNGHLVGDVSGKDAEKVRAYLDGK